LLKEHGIKFFQRMNFVSTYNEYLTVDRFMECLHRRVRSRRVCVFNFLVQRHFYPEVIFRTALSNFYMREKRF